ncbi:hypothetical protein K490DRAFT_52974 [Saccharata proteae CBS 121410]|uniref:Uncharacterized protein n=1 Tax=Saccharata proteae CBS 121410 TaxID=1314787 RepID=A0A9P4I3H4_9PEZI|nr:hypothetical protein K490DRAFT_52974 [Saccharata proteae CBS 121410]
MSPTKRQSSSIFNLRDKRRISSYHTSLSSDSDDAIPLVTLAQPNPISPPATLKDARPSRCSIQAVKLSSTPTSSRPRRMVRYVSHGIGGAGNFTTTFQSDTTRIPEPASTTRTPSSSPPPPASRRGICSCSRCFGKTAEH